MGMASGMLMLSPDITATMASVLLSPMGMATMASVMLSPDIMATMASVRLSPMGMATMASVLPMLSPDMAMATMESVPLSPTMAMATMVRALPEEKKPPRGRGMTERRGLLCIAIDHGDNKNVTKY